MGQHFLLALEINASGLPLLHYGGGGGNVLSAGEAISAVKESNETIRNESKLKVSTSYSVCRAKEALWSFCPGENV